MNCYTKRHHHPPQIWSVEIPTADLKISTTASWKKLLESDWYDTMNRYQSTRNGDMAAKTGMFYYDSRDRNNDNKFGVLAVEASSKKVSTRLRWWPTTGNSNMAAKTGNTHISVALHSRQIGSEFQRKYGGFDHGDLDNSVSKQFRQWPRPEIEIYLR